MNINPDDGHNNENLKKREESIKVEESWLFLLAIYMIHKFVWL